MTFATLRALHAIIGDALAEMERVYDSESQSQPGLGRVDYPALDVPFYKGAPHTPAEEAAERLAGDPAVVVAANQIVAACGQLAASVHRPFFSLVEAAKGVSACTCAAISDRGQGRADWLGVLGWQEHVTACMQFLEASNTVEILRSAGAEGMHVDDIARHIERLNPGGVGSARVDPGQLSEY